MNHEDEPLKETADEEEMTCEERLRHDLESCGKETGDEESKVEVEELDDTQKEDVRITSDSEECGEIKNEHRKKRSREKEDCVDKGVGTDESSSWETCEDNGRVAEADEIAGEEKIVVELDTVEVAEGERAANENKGNEETVVSDEKEIEHEMEVERRCNAKEETDEICDAVIRREEEKMDEGESVCSTERTLVEEEESAMKSEEKLAITEINDNRIKIEDDVICVPSGLTVTKADAKDTSETPCIKNEVKDDSLRAVKVEIKSDLFSTELSAVKKEDKAIGTMCVDSKDKTLVFGSKTQLEDSEDKIPATFLVHRPIQFERLGECMEKANAEVGPAVVTNGDKFNALNHLYSLNSSAVFSNGKELNGGFLLGGTSGLLSSERNWFSVLPRDACDSTSVTNGTCPTR